MSRSRGSLILLFAVADAFAAASCAGAPRANDSEPGSAGGEVHDDAAVSQKVVIVALDGVRPREVFEGVDPGLARARVAEPWSPEALMPNLHRLSRTRGVLLGQGGTMWATGPNYLSLPGYREILTGRAPGACQENECAPLDRDTLADEFRRRAQTPRDVAVISSWEGIAGAAARNVESIVVSCGRALGHNRHLLARDGASAEAMRAGETAAPYPGEGDFRPDALTARIALAYLRDDSARFLFLGLGEPDEYAHRGDYAGYIESLRAADAVIGEIDELFESSGAWQRNALLFVTTDHGRATNFRDHGRDVPESGRVWLLAAGSLIASRPLAAHGRSLHLADIAPAIRAMSGL